MLAHVRWKAMSCPNCGEDYESRLSGAFDGLGPPELRCGSCEHVFRGDRREWAQMTSVQASLMAFVTLVVAVIVGLLGAISTRLAVHFWEAGPFVDSVPNMGPKGGGFLVGAGVWVLVVCLVQAYRLACSDARSKEPRREPFRTNMLTLQLGMPVGILGVVWIPAILSWLSAVGLRP